MKKQRSIERKFGAIQEFFSSLIGLSEEQKIKKTEGRDLRMEAEIRAIQESYRRNREGKERIPSIARRKTHIIVDSARNQKLNKYSFSIDERREIYLGREKRNQDFKNLTYGAR